MQSQPAALSDGPVAHQNKVQYNRAPEEFEKNSRTFPIVLREPGFYTGYAGKWHIGRDSSPRPGFHTWCVLPGQGRYHNPLMNHNGEERGIEGHVDDVVCAPNRGLALNRNGLAKWHLNRRAMNRDAIANLRLRSPWQFHMRL